MEATDGVSAKALGAASECTKSAVHVGVWHLPVALLRLWRRRMSHARITRVGGVATGAEEARKAGQSHPFHQAKSKVLVQPKNQ
jgi:hypothetical protein